MSMKSREHWIEAALFLIPLVVGLSFLAATSAHGDSWIYRSFIRDLHHTGVLPLMRFEWYHPGHYLLVWPVFAVGELLGCWDDPLQAIQLVNFVGAGVAAVILYRMWRGLFPDHDISVALLPGLAVATLPAWLWHSQEGMSDVVGTAFVLGVIGRLLAHDLRGDTAWTPYLLTGFFAAWSFLMRGSTVLFLPMMVFLVVRLLLRRSQVSWRRVLPGLLIGSLIPLVLVYGYLILVHGWTTFRDGYFWLSDHNINPAQRVSELPATLKSWGNNLLHGMGFAVVVALPGCVLLAVQQRLFLWLALLALPYLAGVANNQAAYEMRYMIPTMAAITLGYGAVGQQLQRLGRWAVWLFLVGLVVQSSVRAFPILDVLSTRQYFGEVAARHMVDLAPKRSLLLGVGTHPFLLLLRNEDHPMGVKTEPGTGGRDSWNRTWLAARDVITHHLQLGRGVYYCSEPPLNGFREWLQAAGFEEEVLLAIPAAELRDSYDETLSHADPHAQVVPDPLHVLRLVPPARLQTVVLRVLPEDDPIPGLRLQVHAPAHAGRDYRIIVGSTTTDRVWLRHIDLPFTTGDVLFTTSLAIGNHPRYGLRGFRGKLDAKGHAEAFAPAHVLTQAKELTALAILFEDADSLQTASLASLPVTIK
jgi:hypothetical protein